MFKIRCGKCCRDLEWEIDEDENAFFVEPCECVEPEENTERVNELEEKLLATCKTNLERTQMRYDFMGRE